MERPSSPLRKPATCGFGILRAGRPGISVTTCSPYVTAARYSPSGQWIVSTSNDNSLMVSTAKSGELLVVLRYRNSLFDLVIASAPRGVLLVTGSEAGDVNVMPWFENDQDIVSYAKSVLRDVSPP